MGRKKLDDGKRVTISAKVSEADIARIDGARGDLTRSAWVQRAIGVVLGTVPLSAALPGVSPDAPRTKPSRPRRVVTAAALAQDRARDQRESDCPHPKARIIKGLCNACGTYVGKT